jgi:hypothetical protein
VAGSLKLFGQWRTATGHAFTPGIDEEIYVISDSRFESIVVWQTAATEAWQALAALRLSRVATERLSQMTGLRVVEVNVEIVDLHFPADDREDRRVR